MSSTATAPQATRTYTVPSSATEPTLHCARPAPGCEAQQPDRVEVTTSAEDVSRGDIVVFRAPRLAAQRCGAGSLFIKRVIGLPGETWAERIGYLYIDGKKLDEPYIRPGRRDSESRAPRTLPATGYLMLGDNRRFSCDSRVWGPVPRKNLIGRVTKVLRAGSVGTATTGTGG